MDAGLHLSQRLIRAALRWFALALLGLAAPALAHTGGPEAGLQPACHAYAETSREAAALRSGRTGWICSDDQWFAGSRHTLLRFDLGRAGQVPARLETRLARFEALTIAIERGDGQVSLHQLSTHDFVPYGHMGMAIDLPDSGAPARRITLAFVGATSTPLINNVRLYRQPGPPVTTEQVVLAALCGILLVPLFFNLALFRVLRDRFLLWHIAVVGFLLTHTFISSGLVPLVANVPVGTISMLIALTFCGGAASAIMMASDFIEPDMLAPQHRRALRIAALWVVANIAFFLATMDWLQAYGVNAYYLNWLPVIAIFSWPLWNAYRNGSRAVRFLIASWLPLLVTSLWQIAESMLGNQAEPLSLFIAQRAAIGLEVLIGSIAIADRFIQLRRDHAQSQVLASEMTRLAECDPLTGLLNRRAIESRFAALRKDGFATMALIDLDHFKLVNDRHGHTVGDRVLLAVAAALPEERDILSVRMGGEEFMLLLRGRLAVQRAEHVRRSLTARVAREVDGLDQPLTASMGVVEIPAEVMPDASFAAIYARADGLLYQAKRAGRNRMVQERMTAFARPAAGQGRAASA